MLLREVGEARGERREARGGCMRENAKRGIHFSDLAIDP